MKDGTKIEFSSSSDGRVLVQMDGKFFLLEKSHHELLAMLGALIERQYPEAWNALKLNYKASKYDKWLSLYRMVSRFILCNMGKMDGLSYDVDGEVLHLEDISCPIRQECQFNGIVCHPKLLSLTKREAEIVRLRVKGETYKEISDKLHIDCSTVKNTVQNATKRTKLYSAKDLLKIAAVIL